ncbi:hypothetical protein KCU87_g202, partial [Aureobasidium melanogenum]
MIFEASNSAESIHKNVDPMTTRAIFMSLRWSLADSAPGYVKFHGAKDRDLSSPSETNWTLSPAAAQQKWALFFRAKSEIWSHCLTSLRKYASRTHSRTGLLATSGSSVPSHEAQNG